MSSFRASLGAWVIGSLLVACGPAVVADGGTDAAVEEVDAGPTPVPSLDHCTFVEAPPTGGAGGSVSAGGLTAGTAEALLDVPIGASLAAYTSRAAGFGGDGIIEDERDERRTYLGGSFSPSVGLETVPRIRGLALSAGGETVLIMKLDLATSYHGFVNDLEAELGPEFSGKVIVATSHSHSSFGNYSGHSALAVGFGRFRSSVYRPIIMQMAQVARAALDARRPARIGFAYDGAFDMDDRVNRDRREQNDALYGGRQDDHHLFVIRVDDDADGSPMALVPVFGMHGTLHGADNAIISTDSIGGVERVLEEQFDSQVLVMHLQGAGGDVSPAGRGSIDCAGALVCTDFAKSETVGHFARDAVMAAWTSAATDMQTDLEIEMLSRTIPLGPDYRTFRIRDGALEYAEWNLNRDADGIIYGDDGELVSPIDEFNAPFGAALCDAERPSLIRTAAMPGTQDLDGYTYSGCNRIEIVGRLIESALDVDFEDPPICDTTQTTITALRLGDWMVGTLPGEPMAALVDHLRTLSPMPAERTVVVGYAQNHGGYLLRPEDWLSGGYEPTITFWGPLEGEYIVEQLAGLMALAVTPEREDGNEGGIAHTVTPDIVDDFPPDVLEGTPGTLPSPLPAYLLTRLLRPVTSAQPAPAVRRLESVFFTWIGEDPFDGTPRVFIERETTPGTWETVTRRSGRPVQEGDLILTHTPDPILPDGTTPRTHYYTVELQAVTPLGMPGLDALSDRAGLPLGRYRFVVQGSTGYVLESDPFTVEGAQLTLTSEAAGADLRVTVRYAVPSDGYRLLDLEGQSNAPLPVRNAPVSVTVDGGAAVDLTTDASGVIVIPGAAGATEIVVSETAPSRTGNSGTLSL